MVSVGLFETVTLEPRPECQEGNSHEMIQRKSTVDPLYLRGLTVLRYLIQGLERLQILVSVRGSWNQSPEGTEGPLYSRQGEQLGQQLGGGNDLAVFESCRLG